MGTIRKGKISHGHERKWDRMGAERNSWTTSFCIGLQEKGSRTGSRRINGT